MNKDPVKVGRINARIEKALGYNFGENIFCFITEDKLREFSVRYPDKYLKKVEEATNIMKEPLYVGIDEEKKRLYFIKEYLVKNQFFKKACLILDFSKQLTLTDIIPFDEQKMALLCKTTRFVSARA
ncbi:MAG: hypothetical protein MJ228_05235 [Bacilli bacterium]|nr:hypothetical protein [Bacilli bacterium]